MHYPTMAKQRVAPNPNVGPNIAALMDYNPDAGSQPLLASKTGIGQTTIGRILRSEVSTSAEKLQKIAAVFKVSVDDLYLDHRRFLQALEKGTLGGDDAPAPVARAQYLPGFEELQVPLLAQAGSMGHGEDQMHDEVVVGRLTVSPQWVARTIKPLTKLENLRFIHGYGDSMDPTFADGDILLVDAGIQEPKIDGVYVLEANDRIYIKRVRQRMDGSFEISSDNPNVRTVDVLDGSKPVAVRGRVVWAWNGKKL